jgi:hypothetical protein
LTLPSPSDVGPYRPILVLSAILLIALSVTVVARGRADRRLAASCLIAAVAALIYVSYLGFQVLRFLDEPPLAPLRLASIQPGLWITGIGSLVTVASAGWLSWPHLAQLLASNRRRLNDT